MTVNRMHMLVSIQKWATGRSLDSKDFIGDARVAMAIWMFKGATCNGDTCSYFTN